MRNVSEQFKEALGELVRPATRLYFEVDSSTVFSGIYPSYDSEYPTEDYGFDTGVAPIVRSEACTNEKYYAVLGDSHQKVDDPNLICAPANPATMPTNEGVPFGITPIVESGDEIMLGSNVLTQNWYGYSGTLKLKFKGKLPREIRVECYDGTTESWFVDATIEEFENGEYIYRPSARGMEREFTRFYASSVGEPGRFQLMRVMAMDNDFGYDDAIVFENEYIASIDISQETDLTSQTFPSYEMTVECLDVDEQYKPDTWYWEEKFYDGSPCFLKIGYEFEDGIIEYIPFFAGYLTKAPDYGDGKITFYVVAQTSTYGDTPFKSLPDKTLNTGDEVKDLKFYDLLTPSLYYRPLFDSIDIFRDATDQANSKTNFYGNYDYDEARQLTANALGGYITFGVHSVNLRNTIALQYKSFDDYMTRYEQIQNTLESQPKVSSIAVVRNKNTVATDSVQVTLPEKIYIHANSPAYEFGIYNIPFFAVSKFVVNDYQKSVPSAAVTAVYDAINFEEVKEDGTVDVKVAFTTDTNTYVQPIITFYGVKNEKFTESDADFIGGSNGEKYENNNDLITNSYLANKVKQVARMINDIPNKYEVDVVQDYRYELGDIIRLETQKDTFKTCVITGLNFRLPGSSGHLTCRKIFSLLDCPYAVVDAVGLTIANASTHTTYAVSETSESAVVLSQGEDSSYYYVMVFGMTKYTTNGGSETHAHGLLTDLNGHDWHLQLFSFLKSEGYETNANVFFLPEYDAGSGTDIFSFFAVETIKAIYEEQGMTAPVDYTCLYETIQ